MTMLTKTLLSVSAAGFLAGGIIDFGGHEVVPALTAVLPMGAVFFGLFMISLIMEKEMAGFEQEESGRLQLVKCDTFPPAPHKPVSRQTIALPHDN